LVYAVSDDTITCEYDRRVEDYWPKIIGLDFGWDHPSAAVKIAWNRDDDII